MAQVFISYSHKDSEYAHQLADVLSRQGIDAWIDDRIDYGTNWPRVIQENLDACSIIIVIMSPTAYQSDWVQNELSYARGKGKSIFSVLLEGAAWASLASTQFFDARNDKAPIEKLIGDINRTLIPKRPPRSIPDQIHAKIPRAPSQSLAETPLHEKKSPSKNTQSIHFLNQIGLRALSVIAGLLAAIMLRLLSDDYYNPNDSSLLSRIAEFVAHSDFTFLLLILIAMAGAFIAIHQIDNKKLENIEMPMWFRYLISLPTGCLAGTLVDIVAVIAVVLVVPAVLLLILGVLALLIYLGSLVLGRSGGNSSSAAPTVVEQSSELPTPTVTPINPFEGLYSPNNSTLTPPSSDFDNSLKLDGGLINSGLLGRSLSPEEIEEIVKKSWNLGGWNDEGNSNEKK